NALVMIVRDEIEDVFLEIRAGAADGRDLVLANHLGQRETELGRRHRPRQRDQHLSAVFEVAVVVARGRLERGGIEVSVVVIDELRDGTHLPSGKCGRIVPHAQEATQLHSYTAAKLQSCKAAKR